ncbi:MAG: hypothetical protein IH784_05390, partial [Bacteroidetes bacterium]|nr:hypothetical protein [Bacteroidota bacterium]
MKKSIFKYYLLSLLFFAVNFAQNIELENYKLTGNLLADSKIVLNDYEELSAVFALDDLPDKKSPVLAGVMSLVLPGSGELYVGEYLKAAIFFAVEVTLITVAVVNNNEGDKLTAEFEAFADEHWSAVDYSEYMMEHWQELGLKIWRCQFVRRGPRCRAKSTQSVRRIHAWNSWSGLSSCGMRRDSGCRTGGGWL